MFSKWRQSCSFLLVLVTVLGTTTAVYNGEHQQQRFETEFSPRRPDNRRPVYDPVPTTPEPVSVIQKVMTQAQENANHQGNCRLNKVTLSQSGESAQYIQYLTNFPPIKQFHFCLWLKSYNLSQEHTLFSYAVSRNPNMIVMWISPEPKNRQTGFHLVLDGVKVYNINYLIPTGKWVHICQSWNGENGHWGIFVNGISVGDGYGPSKLIRFEIPGGGRPITGRGQDLQKGNNKQGIEGEVTLFEMEDVALGVGVKGSTTLRPLQTNCLPRQSPGNLISWGKTHLKLFGGAEIYGVQPICGHFQE